MKLNDRQNPPIVVFTELPELKNYCLALNIGSAQNLRVQLMQCRVIFMLFLKSKIFYDLLQLFHQDQLVCIIHSVYLETKHIDSAGQLICAKDIGMTPCLTMTVHQCLNLLANTVEYL